MTTVEVLKAARKRVEWDKDRYLAELRKIKYSLMQRCALGALGGVPALEHEIDNARSALLLFISSTDWQSISGFNDARTHAEVIALFDRAIVKLEKK